MARVRKMVSFPKDTRKKAENQKKALFALSIDTTPAAPPNGGLRTETMGLLAGPLASLLHTLADEFRRKYDKTVQGWLKDWGTPDGPALVFDNERARVGRTYDYVDLEVIEVEWMDGTKSKFSDTSLTKHKKLPSFQVSGPELWVPNANLQLQGTTTGRFSVEGPTRMESGRPSPQNMTKATKDQVTLLRAIWTEAVAYDRPVPKVGHAIEKIEAMRSGDIHGELDAASERNGGPKHIEMSMAGLQMLRESFGKLKADFGPWGLTEFLDLVRMLGEAPEPVAGFTPPKGDEDKVIRFLSFILSIDGGGTEIQQHGPYESPEARDAEAKKMFRTGGQDDGFNVFGLDVPQIVGMHPTVFSFTNMFTEADDEDIGDFYLSEPEINFFEVEIRNEASGGDKPSTLQSAYASLLQADAVTIANWCKEKAAGDEDGREAFMTDVENLMKRWGPKTPLQTLLDLAKQPPAGWDRAKCYDYIRAKGLSGDREWALLNEAELRTFCEEHVAQEIVRLGIAAEAQENEGGPIDNTSGEAANWDRKTCAKYVTEHELFTWDQVNHMSVEELRAEASKHQALQGRDGA